MKRKLKLIALAILCCCGIQPLSAQTLKDFFSSSDAKVLYLGIDYTQARLLDDAGADVPAIKTNHIPAINDVVVNEPKKFDLAGAFHKDEVTHDLSLVAKRNAKINTDDFLSTNAADWDRLKKADIEKLVKGFDFGGKKGFGVLFVVEAMSKAKKGESVWVTIIDMGSKKTLMAERLIGETGMAIGFRNYWVRPITDILKEIEKKKYKEWKAAAGA